MKPLKLLIITTALLLAQQAKADYICYYLIHTEIAASLKENGRQKDMRKGATQNLALENLNKQEFTKFAKVQENIRGRLSKVSLLVQAAPVAWNIVQYIEDTYKYQEKAFNELKDAPYFVLTALSEELDLAMQVKDNSLLVYGLVATYGTLNQMENKDRRVLLKFAEDEFHTLSLKSFVVYSKIIAAKRAWAWKKDMLKYSIKEDKKMFNDIIKAVK